MERFSITADTPNSGKLYVLFLFRLQQLQLARHKTLDVAVPVLFQIRNPVNKGMPHVSRKKEEVCHKQSPGFNNSSEFIGLLSEPGNEPSYA